MSETNLDTIEAQISELFKNQEYSQVLALASQAHASGHFPEAAPYFYYYQICAATRLQDTATAFQLMDQMLEEGLWLGKSLLRDSPSLKQLQDDPVFERQLTRNYERQHAIPATTIFLEPRDRLTRTAGGALSAPARPAFQRQQREKSDAFLAARCRARLAGRAAPIYPVHLGGCGGLG